ncbi:molybdopterin synthase catalytic subunit [Pleomorphomonas diazotrophica]|uniref:Molybdopterin synthase catalytic subunit n=1 Tax=Pleomorphomonas diazotrophica TaxID=1166257 RepID=A0A1I4VZQ5_9HYPH|nr:molybdenum cofactor biosynthesis protein MoaE [Pleomorphomonas diazotrophica]PKR88255.1 molybdopterin synthase catalytic subunit [Pleomorphomonas diazotrophica]SFN06683.1 molybdopterin synthase subunit MoaE [Pleomorphomonas diazotrophica]
MTTSETRIIVRVGPDDFDVGAEIEALQDGDPAVGAVTSFVGYCRDEDGRLAALELEYYPGMAEAEIGRVVNEAVARWPLLAVTVVHRGGRIKPGERIVLVAVSSSHRDAAFAACDYIMDFLKTRAPFWKKEHPADRSEGGWVEAKAHDDARAERWKDEKG